MSESNKSHVGKGGVVANQALALGAATSLKEVFENGLVKYGSLIKWNGRLAEIFPILRIEKWQILDRIIFESSIKGKQYFGKKEK